MAQKSTVTGVRQAQDWNATWGFVVCIMLVATVVVWILEVVVSLASLVQSFLQVNVDESIVFVSAVVGVELVFFAAVVGLTDLSERNLPYADRTFGRMFGYTLVCILLSGVSWWLASNHYTAWALTFLLGCAVLHPVLGFRSILDERR